MPSQYLPLKPEEPSGKLQPQKPLTHPRFEPHVSRIDLVLLTERPVSGCEQAVGGRHARGNRKRSTSADNLLSFNDCSTVTPNLYVTSLPAPTSEQRHCFAPRDKSGSCVNGNARRLHRSVRSVVTPRIIVEIPQDVQVRMCRSYVLTDLLNIVLLVTWLQSCQSSQITSLPHHFVIRLVYVGNRGLDKSP